MEKPENVVKMGTECTSRANGLGRRGWGIPEMRTVHFTVSVISE